MHVVDLLLFSWHYTGTQSLFLVLFVLASLLVPKGGQPLPRAFALQLALLAFGVSFAALLPRVPSPLGMFWLAILGLLSWFLAVGLIDGHLLAFVRFILGLLRILL